MKRKDADRNDLTGWSDIRTFTTGPEMWNDTDGNGVPDDQEPVGLSSLVGGLPTDGIKVVQLSMVILN
jgi:hypothetical protein